MTPKQTSATELRNWRRARNISQRQLSGYLGLTITTISKWENYNGTAPLWLHWALRGMDDSLGEIDFDHVTLPNLPK